ncbi:MAG TPA: PP2C family serine/threonine-protein phosphatase [Pyrinomonadaceae bacterium]|nr:PP2C family serine/threonine-protein phosphatase [Pyrinomonadaceae bacterium]
MSKDSKAFKVQSSALSDRGLNERRPLNEDSYLADAERFIFAVADGVGGAEAGEVASQTAIEVLDEAFRHQTNGADIEDLMELAIQRANASIHQMAQEHAKFSMMATTIVALHLNGNVATFGHVGDSRLYRLTPDGKLHRETEDHSVVEEEVRAGRMTAEQAANHPSKNVISRALGAEDSVEVDMKTMEVEEGTEFLLCTDGITRHVSDNELRQLLILNDDLESTCVELKRRCYERGAEDNLTVVVVRAGKRIATEDRTEELEPTIAPDYKQPIEQSDVATAQASGLVAPSRIAFPAPNQSTQAVPENRPVVIEDSPTKRSGAARFFGFLFVLALIGAAFYAGARYRDRVRFLPGLAGATNTDPATVASPTPVPEDPLLKFERARREVDRDPRNWINTEIPKELVSAGVQSALDSPNAAFLYLYGRASLLTGNADEAMRAFDAAITRAGPDPAAETIKKEAALGFAAASFKTQKDREKALVHFDEAMKAPAAPTPP